MKRYQQGKQRDYRSKVVKGWIADNSHIGDVNVHVRMTSDERGQSLSFSIEEGDIMMQIGIPLEKVKDIIRVTKREP